MKRSLLLCFFLLILLLKLLLPPDREEARQALRFLGLERETVQAFGQSLDADAHWQSVFSPNP